MAPEGSSCESSRSFSLSKPSSIGTKAALPAVITKRHSGFSGAGSGASTLARTAGSCDEAEQGEEEYLRQSTAPSSLRRKRQRAGLGTATRGAEDRRRRWRGQRRALCVCPVDSADEAREGGARDAHEGEDTGGRLPSSLSLSLCPLPFF